jgi:hypothetical protein
MSEFSGQIRAYVKDEEIWVEVAGITFRLTKTMAINLGNWLCETARLERLLKSYDKTVEDFNQDLEQDKYENRPWKEPEAKTVSKQECRIPGCLANDQSIFYRIDGHWYCSKHMVEHMEGKMQFVVGESPSEHKLRTERKK